jgi:putative glutamine amidotransferase
VTTETKQHAGPGWRAGDGQAGGRRPVIGISSYAEQASWGRWNAATVLLPRRYADSVAAAGGIPVLLPPLSGIEEAVARLDGLILAGGGDIDPAEFGARPDPQTQGIRPDRDAAELALASAALERGLAILGICRGMQVLNVARGGTLHQHLPDLVGHDGHSPVSGGYGSHPVKVAAGSRLAAALGHPGPQDEIPVPTHHHQAVDRLGEGLAASAWTADGVIEAVEFAAAEPNGAPRDGSGFALAVQWHPEAGQDQRLFGALVAGAGRRQRA